jgi:hypothetical protein
VQSVACPVAEQVDGTSVTVLKTVIVGVAHLDSDEVPVTNFINILGSGHGALYRHLIPLTLPASVYHAIMNA